MHKRIHLTSSLIPLLLLLGYLLLTIGHSEATLLMTIPAEEGSGPGAVLYKKGVAALEKGDLINAEKHFLERLDLDSEHPGALVGLALVADKQGRKEKSEQFFKRALSAAPDNAVVRGVWARYLEAGGMLKDAEREFRHGISLDPDMADLHLELGMLYLNRLREFKAAVVEFEEVIRLDPLNSNAHLYMGGAKATMGQTDEAQTAFEEAGRLDPSNPLPYHALGRLHADKREYTKALDAFLTALRANPGFYRAHLARGDIFLSMGNEGDALSAYDSALKIRPDQANVYLKIGIIHKQNKRYLEAEKALLASIRLVPNNPVAYNNLSWMMAEQGKRLDEALKWAEKAVRQSPQSAEFQDTLGWVHYRRGELGPALSILRKASVISPERAEIHYHLGIVLMEKNMRPDAASAFEKALKLDPDFRFSADTEQRLAELRSMRSK